MISLLGHLFLLLLLRGTASAQHVAPDTDRQFVIDTDKSVVDKTGWAPLFGEPDVPKPVGVPTKSNNDVKLQWRAGIVRHPPVTYNVFCAIGVQTSCKSVNTADMTGIGETGIEQSPLVVTGTVRNVDDAGVLTCFIVAKNDRGQTCSDPIPV